MNEIEGLRPSKRLAMSMFLKEVDVKFLIAAETTNDGKTPMHIELGSIINLGLDSFIPITTKTIYCSNCLGYPNPENKQLSAVKKA